MKNVIRLVIAILLCVCMVISAEKNIKIKKIPSGSINENLNNFIEIKDGNQINYIAEKKDEIVFLNKNMKIKQSITPKPGAKLSKIIYSKKGKYILLMEHIPVDKNTDFHINYHRNLSLINHKNKIMWEKKEYYNVDDLLLPTRIISDYNGNTFEFSTKQGVLKTIDSLGNVINQYKIFPDLDKYMDYKSKINISKDGKHIVLIANKKQAVKSGRYISRNNKRVPGISSERQSGEPTLFLFNNNGELLKSIRCKEEDAVKIGISDNGDKILYSTKNIDADGPDYVTTILNRNLENDVSFDFIVRKFKFINNYLIYETSRGRGYNINKYNLQKKSLVFSTKLNAPTREITYNKDLNIICNISQNWATTSNPNPPYSVDIIDNKGEILKNIAIEDSYYIGDNYFKNKDGILKIDYNSKEK